MHECPVCNTNDKISIGNLEYTLFDNSLISNKYNIISCKKCGFVRNETISKQEDYNKFYEESFYSNDYIKNKQFINQNNNKDEDNYINQNNNKDEDNYINNIIYRLSPIKKDSIIFDIGCGTGSLIKKFHKLGYQNLYAIDPSQECINLLKNSENNINIQTGSIFNIPLPEIKANVIILNHVLEHILDLKLALKNIHNKLYNNGIVYVEVPDTMRFDIDNEINPLRFFYIQHLIHFNKVHLKNLFITNGFIELESGNSIRIEKDLIMPCIWSIFKKKKIKEEKLREHTKNKSCYKPHFNLSKEIKKWLRNKKSLDTNNILYNLKKSNNVVYIWGIGTHLQLILASTPLKDCNIKYFIDNDKRVQKKTINNKQIYSISKLKTLTDKDTVVIGAPTHAKEMRDYLIKKLNFKGQIITINFGGISSNL